MKEELESTTPSMQALKDRYGFDTVGARRELARLAGDISGPNVLDIGTGSGLMAMILADRGFMVVSVDVDRAALQHPGRRLRDAGPEVPARVRFVHADALGLPFAAATFDAVFSFDSIHHMRDCRAALEEMVRVCRPSGVIAIADLHSRGLEAVRTENAGRGESHYKNACRVDAIAEILHDLELTFRRCDSAFVCNFIIRIPAPSQDANHRAHRKRFKTLTIHSTLPEIANVRSKIVDEAERRKFSESEVFALTLGLSEALANAYAHGSHRTPDKLIVVKYRISAEEAEIRVIDEGDGFAPELVPDPTDAQHLELAHGRGLLLMHTLLDDVRFCRRGTCVRLIKRHRELENADPQFEISKTSE